MTDYDTWVESVRLSEYAIAQKAIASGKDIEQVLDTMSKNIVKKLLHPVFVELRNPQSTYDSEKSQKEYKELYSNHVNKSPDQI